MKTTAKLCSECGQEIKEPYYYYNKNLKRIVKSRYCQFCRELINEKMLIKIKDDNAKRYKEKTDKEMPNTIIVDGYIFKKISDRHYINAHGHVWNNKSEKYIKWLVNPSGYCKVILPQGQRYIHRLVYEYFGTEEMKDKLTVNHKDHDKSNNYINNLELMTHADNCRYFRDKVKSGEIIHEKGRKMYVVNVKSGDRKYCNMLRDIDTIMGKRFGFTSVRINTLGKNWYKEFLFVDKLIYEQNDMENKSISDIMSIVMGKEIPNFSVI